MKFPVFGAIGATFAFMFRNALDLLQVVWASLVLQWIGYLLIMPGYVRSTSALAGLRSADQPPPDMAAVFIPYVSYIAALTVVITITSVVMFSGVTRLIVRQQKPSLPFYLAWGADEWRILGSWLILAAIFAGLAALGGIALALGPLMTAMGPGPGGIISIVAVAGVGLAGIWLCARLSLAVPASIGLKKIGIGPSWSITDDHTWPVIGFWFLLTIIAVLVQFVLGAFLVPPGYNEAMQGMMSGNPDDLKRASEEMNAIMVQSYDISDIGNLIRVSLSFLLSAAALLVMAVAGAIAWRALTDKSEPEVFS